MTPRWTLDKLKSLLWGREVDILVRIELYLLSLLSCLSAYQGVVLSLATNMSSLTILIRVYTVLGVYNHCWYIFHNRDMKFVSVINSKTMGKVPNADRSYHERPGINKFNLLKNKLFCICCLISTQIPLYLYKGYAISVVLIGWGPVQFR